jgi:hypothetical protein
LAGSTIILFPINPQLLVEKSLELALLANRMVGLVIPVLKSLSLLDL